LVDRLAGDSKDSAGGRGETSSGQLGEDLVDLVIRSLKAPSGPP